MSTADLDRLIKRAVRLLRAGESAAFVAVVIECALDGAA